MTDNYFNTDIISRHDDIMYLNNGMVEVYDYCLSVAECFDSESDKIWWYEQKKAHMCYDVQINGNVFALKLHNYPFEFFIKMTVNSPIARMMTIEESSSIAFVKVEDLQVTIAYQRNPDKQYTYIADREFANQLTSILEAENLGGLSLGGTIADARRIGDLEQTL